MPQRVSFPEGRTGPAGEEFVNFPDSFTPEDINSTFASMFPEPEEVIEQPGIVENIGRGLASGVVGFGEAALRTGQAAAILTPSIPGVDFTEELFEAGANRLQEIQEDVGPIHIEPLPRLADVFEEEGLVSAIGEAFTPSRILPQLAEFVPQLASILAFRGAGLIAARGAKLSDPLVKAAGFLSGSVAGGIQEGTGSFKETIQKGGSKELAAGNLFATTAITGALNALGAEAIVSKLPAGFGRKLTSLFIRGGVEATTEFLEEPAQIALLKAEGFDIDVIDRLKAAIDVIPVAFIAGGGASFALDLVQDTAAGLELSPEQQAALEEARNTQDARIPLVQAEDAPLIRVPTLSHAEVESLQSFGGTGRGAEPTDIGLIDRINIRVEELFNEGITDTDEVINSLLKTKKEGGMLAKDKGKIRLLARDRVRSGLVNIQADPGLGSILDVMREVLKDTLVTDLRPEIRQAAIERNNFITATEGQIFTELTTDEIEQIIIQGAFPISKENKNALAKAFDLPEKEGSLAAAILADVVRHNALQAGIDPNEFVKTRIAGFKRTKAPPIIDPEGQSLPEGIKDVPANILVGDGEQAFKIEFSSDLDKAGFLVALDTPSLHHDELLTFIKETAGLDSIEAIQVGKIVQRNAQLVAESQDIRAESIKVANVFIPAMIEAQNAKDRIDLGPLAPPVKEGELVRGQIIGIDPEGKADVIFNASRFLFRGMTAPDLSVALHEIGHFAALTSSGQFKKSIESTFAGGKKVEDWKKDDHEKFAEAFQVFFMTGLPPSPKSSDVFSAVKDAMNDIYIEARETLEGNITMPQKESLSMLFINSPSIPSVRSINEISEMTENISALFAGGRNKSPIRKIDREAFRAAGFKPETIKIVQAIMNRASTNAPITHEDLLAVAQEKAMDDQIVRKLINKALRRVPLTNYEITAMGFVRYDTIQTLENMLEHTDDPLTVVAYTEFLQEIENALTNARSESGRALNAWKTGPMIPELIKSIAVLGKEILPSQAALLNRTDFSNLKQVQELIAVFKPGSRSRRAIKSLFFESMLFNPGTIGINWLSNFTNAVYTSGTRAHMALMDKFIAKITGRNRRVVMGEAFDIFGAQIRSITTDTSSLFTGNYTKAQKTAMEAFFGIRQPDGTLAFATVEDSKWDEILGVMTSRGFEDIFHDFSTSDGRFIFRKGNFKGRNIGELLALGLNGGTRTLRGMDMWQKATIWQAEEKAIRTRLDFLLKNNGQQAVNQEIDRVIEEESKRLSREDILASIREKSTQLSIEEGLTDSEGNLRIRSLTTDEKLTSLIVHRTRRLAEDITFQSAPGNITKVFMKGREQTGAMGLMMIPFIQTPANIIKRGIEFIPGFGAYTAAKWSGIPPAEIWAKQIEGLVIIGSVMALMQSGALTGPSPDEPAEREAFFREGKLPFALRIGDNYIQYRRMEPFAIPVGMMAGLIIELQQIQKNNLNPAREPKDTFDTIAALLNVATDLMIDSTFMQGFLGYLGTDRDLTRSFARTTSSFIPYSSMTRFLNREAEAFKTGEIKLLENDTYFDIVGTSLPVGMFRRSESDTRLNVFGEEIVRETNFLKEWLPLRMQTAKGNPLEDEFLSLDHYPGLPGRILVIKRRKPGVRMPDDLYREYVTNSGTRIKKDLDNIIQRPFYINSTKENRIRMQQRIVNRIRRQESKKIKRKMRSLGL